MLLGPVCHPRGIDHGVPGALAAPLLLKASPCCAGWTAAEPASRERHEKTRGQNVRGGNAGAGNRAWAAAGASVAARGYKSTQM